MNFRAVVDLIRLCEENKHRVGTSYWPEGKAKAIVEAFDASDVLDGPMLKAALAKMATGEVVDERDRAILDHRQSFSFATQGLLPMYDATVVWVANAEARTSEFTESDERLAASRRAVRDGARRMLVDLCEEALTIYAQAIMAYVLGDEK
jgi:hypothetical protein